MLLLTSLNLLISDIMLGDLHQLAVLLSVSRALSATYYERASAVVEPRALNCLPNEVSDVPNAATFLIDAEDCLPKDPRQTKKNKD